MSSDPILWNLQTNDDIDESNVRYGNDTDKELEGSNYTKQNKKRITKGSQKQIQHCIQLWSIMLDEMLNENIFRLCFQSNILSNIPTFPLTVLFSWQQLQKNIIRVLNIFYYLISSSSDEEDMKTHEKTRSWLKRWERLRYFTNLVQGKIKGNMFKEMLRMSHEDFKTLLNSIGQHIMPLQVNGENKVITASKILALTFWFLWTSESFKSLSF